MSSAARFDLGGNISSISSFHWTASANVWGDLCEIMPLQSGNSNPWGSSVGGTGPPQLFVEFIVPMLKDGRPEFRFVQVQSINPDQLDQILGVFDAAVWVTVLNGMTFQRDEMKQRHHPK